MLVVCLVKPVKHLVMLSWFIRFIPLCHLRKPFGHEFEQWVWKVQGMMLFFQNIQG